MKRERRYPSDLTDAQWEIVEPMLPLIKEPGRIPKHPRRAIVDAILYVVRSGCSWRQLPVDFPPWQTVYWQFQQWEQRQVTERILEELREQLRLAEGREPEPSAGVMDSQSVKAADTVGRDSRGYDAGKKVNGRKRFIVTDTLGLLVVVCVMSASWQDRDGAKTTLLSTYTASPIRYVFADQGFAGKLVDWAAETLKITVEIVRKPADQQGFVVHPKRWVVERSLAWLTAHRRLARDYERDPAVSEALIRWAAINTMVRRLDRGRPATRQARRTLSAPG
ncbi:IS5 family transposase [Couchioplanes caeruleus]|uniref:IS5 family transposase n=1 Tax=Couchioplanes caeruleus TaxID=56438 RepID=UPI00201C24D2|nr:IS5 family transposase [Couchioplanes caeruleus]UQU67426.1 IS5 family transposase [Couchioplanes caeruleus]UQU67578.1 IS5 family transposase [Couchioplanes caeruleus]